MDTFNLSFYCNDKLNIIEPSFLYSANCTNIIAITNSSAKMNITCIDSTLQTRVLFSSNTMMYLMSLFYSVVFIIGLSGNSLVIYVVLRYSKMQTVTNMYILNLALADELFLVGIPFLITTMSLHKWIFGHMMCKMYMTTTSINQFTSSIFLTVMSADRYIAVCHPISSSRLRTPFISKVVCLTSWTASALLMVPIFRYADLIPDKRTDSLSCNIIWPESDMMNGQNAFTMYCFALSFGIPLVLISVFYYMVVRRLKTVGPRNKSKEKKKSHRKVTKLVLTVVTVYMACWLPYWASQVALTFSEPKRNQSHFGVILHLIAGCLAYSNSAVNPVLYAFLSDNFKKSFIKACICAGGSEVNDQLRLENSVFPRKNKHGSEKTRIQEQESDDEGCNDVDASTAVTMTSRSTNHMSSVGAATSSHCSIHGNDDQDSMLHTSHNGCHLKNIIPVNNFDDIYSSSV